MSSFADLEKCIQANISAPSNDIRTKAELHLKQLKEKQPQQFFEGISQLIMKSKDNQVRSFCAVLLKQNLGIFDDAFFKLPSNSQGNIKQFLLNQIENEGDIQITRHIAECIACLTSLLAQNNQNGSCWKELPSFLMKLAASKHAFKRAAFYACIDKLASNAMDTLRTGLNMNDLRDALAKGLQDKTDCVRECALGAVVALLCELSEPSELNFFHKMVPLLFANISTQIGDKSICKTCQCLQMLAENQPSFFANSMENIVKCLVLVIQCHSLEWDTRKLCMTLLVTLLSEHCEKLQPVLADMAKQVIPLVFQFLATFDDTDFDWNSPDDDDEQYHFQFGAEILPDVVAVFGAEVFLNVAKPIFDAGFADSNNEANWKQTLIALKTVEVTLEACIDLYEPQLPSIMNATGRSLSNNNAYIKYAALSVIKQLSVVFGDDKTIFLVPFHEPIMKALSSMLTNYQSQHRCVLIQICDAMAQFAYIDEDNEVISKYCGSILNGLFNLLSKCDDTLIKTYALKAISVICSIIQDEFNEFYAILMKYNTQLLQDIFGGNVKDEEGKLRGRVMECIGQMILVVDAQQCRGDAHNIIKFLLPFQKQEQENAHSESYSFMMALFASIAEVLGTEFTPYVQHVIPPLLQTAQKNAITVGIANSMAMEDDHKFSKQDEHIVTEEFGGIKLQVNTAEMNEKIVAIQQFPRYAVCLEGELLQFVKPMSAVLTNTIKTRSLSSEPRRYAIETMSPLVNCLKLGLLQKNVAINEVNKWVTEFVSEMLPSLIDALSISDQVDEFSLICKTVKELLDFIDVAVFKNADLISDITELIQTAISERQVRRELNEEQSMELLDAEIEQDVEADLADTMVDLVNKLVSLFGDKYVPIFDKFCGKLCIDLLAIQNNDYANNSNPAEEDQILSLALLTEVIRYGGNDAAQKYLPCVLKLAQTYLSSNDPSMNSAALTQQICYAIGIAANKQYLNASNTSKWLGLLKNVVDAPNARDDENVAATENAIAAIGKILQSYSSKVNNAQSIIAEWMQMLPLMSDAEEREFCNDYILDMLQNTNMLKEIVQSKNGKMIAKLLEIMAVSIQNDDKAKQQYQQLFNHLKSQCDGQLMQNCVSTLDAELHGVFQ